MQKENIGKPIEYIRGFADFLGCKIDLSKRPLIPRPETAFWVSQTIQDILKYSSLPGCCVDEKIKVLDIFSGSGCVGLAVLEHVKNVEVVFADKDPNCLKQIKINLKLNSCHIRANKKVRVIKSDVFENIEGEYDFILANPPYVATKKIKQVQDTVLKYEPKEALFGGEDGLFFINKFLKQAKKYLNPGGKIYMEFSPEQKKQVKILLCDNNYKTWKFFKDQFDKWRWVVICD
jgi:release factor glutamine methyltransferase